MSTDAATPVEREAGSSRHRWATPALLLGATLMTTLYTGLSMSETYGRWLALRGLFGLDFADAIPPWWSHGAVWLDAAGFSLGLLTILFAHEMGHFVTAQRRGVEVSPPYFIPWFPPLGTMGAFIRMESTSRMSSRSLMRVAAYGPFAGLIVAIPVLLAGLAMSDVRPLPEQSGEVMELGSCLLLWGLERVFFGALPEGHDVFLHPIAFAGWAGCFVTGFNLVPLGQLDGGHVAYALFGERFNRASLAIWLSLVTLGVVAFPGWLVLAALLWMVVGVKHPPLMRGDVARGTDRTIGWVAVAVFVLTFIPRPFVMPLPWEQLLSIWS